MKKFLILLLTAALLLSVLAPAALAGEASGETEYYVYTENGKPLNVRSGPNGKIVGTLNSGEKLENIVSVDKNWVEITFHYTDPEKGEGDWSAFVNRRYLLNFDPAGLQELVAAEEEGITGDPLMDINAEFAEAMAVEPYRIMIRPARVSSWVNMRWIPSETGMIVAQYKATEELIVLKDMKNYLQVQDPDTGDVGYIHRKFAVR